MRTPFNMCCLKNEKVTNTFIKNLAFRNISSAKLCTSLQTTEALIVGLMNFLQSYLISWI